jgi:NADPH2:quinone reductase
VVNYSGSASAGKQGVQFQKKAFIDNVLFQSIAFEGTLLPIGFTSGEIPSIPANLILVKNIRVVGVFWGNNAYKNPAAFQESVEGITSLLQQGKIKPQIGKIFPLEQVF